MKPDELFQQLGHGDAEMKEARDWVSYKKFGDTIPEVLLLDEYVNTVFKKTFSAEQKPQLWFSERYMIELYLQNDIPASDDYIRKMLARIEILKNDIQTTEAFLHLHQFLKVLTEHISTKRTIVSKDVLEYLNKLYKTKGIK